MIKFVLLCARGHEFQSWFRSSEAFDTQVESGLVICPLCQVTEVTKAVMAPAIASRGEAACAKPPAQSQSQTKVALLDRHDLKSRAMIDAFRRRIFAEADDVGSRFAEEARKIHNGLVPARPIHGQASIGDARALIEEGVPVLPVPPSPDEYN
jgi:hypothetical protein